MTRERLIKFYEERLEKVKLSWGNDTLRGSDYIKFAEEELLAVKNGRSW